MSAYGQKKEIIKKKIEYIFGWFSKKMKTSFSENNLNIKMIWKKGKYHKTSTMVTVIFMQSVVEIALPVKKLSSKNWSNLSGVWRFSVTNFKLP